MTPDNASDSASGNAGTPRLADRLSALVGQAAARQDEPVSADRLIAAITAHVDAATGDLQERIDGIEAAQAGRMSALEALVADRLGDIEAAVTGGAGGSVDLKAHVDEVGGAVVLRLDEVLAGLADQIESTSAQLVNHVADTQASLSVQADAASRAAEQTSVTLSAALDAARQELALQLTEATAALTTRVDGVDATVRGHVGDLAAGVLELGGGGGLTRDDVDAALTGIHAGVRDLPGLFDGVAQAAQLEGVVASTGAFREQLDEVASGLAAMRAEFDGLQAAIEQRVDDAALALAETLVAVITSLPVARPVTAFASADEGAETAFASADEGADADVAEGGDADGDWAASDPVEELISEVDDEAVEPGVDTAGDDTDGTFEQLDQAAIVEESEEQATGVDEGSIYEGGTLESPSFSSSPALQSTRRKGLFRR